MTSAAAAAIRQETVRMLRPLDDESEPPIPDDREVEPSAAALEDLDAIADRVTDARGRAGAVPQQLEPPQLDVTRDVYRVTWSAGVEAELERFVEQRSEISAELTIRSSRPPRPGLLHSARFRLTSTRERQDLERALRRRLDGIDAHELLEQLCFLVRERYRRGDAAVDMREYVRPVGARWLLEPFVERSRPTILFADGGRGKSLIAVGMAVTVASGTPVLGELHGDPAPVLYLDFEVDAPTFGERLDAILAGAGIRRRPPIFYRRAAASLIEAAATLRREVLERGIGFVVVDSIGWARNGEPESAELTIQLFNAARSLGVPWMGIDHVTKAQATTGASTAKPFGSGYTFNGAGMTWGLDTAQDEGADAITVALVNRKRNNGRLLPRRGLRIEFENDGADELRAVRFRRQELADSPLAETLSLRERILYELRPGPAEIPALAEQLGYADEAGLKTVRSRVGEMARRGELVRLEDRRVALAAREPA